MGRSRPEPSVLAEVLATAIPRGWAQDVAPAFRRWALSLGADAWSTSMSAALMNLSDGDAARDLSAALIDCDAPGCLAVRACLAPAAGVKLSERAGMLEGLAGAPAQILAAAPFVASLAAMPHRPGPTLSIATTLPGRIDTQHVLAVLGPDVALRDLEEIVAAGARVDVCAHRPTRPTIERWMAQATDPHLSFRARIVDTLQDESDLNDEAHRAMSADADAIAAKALEDPVWAALLAWEGFDARHRASAELALSDRLFAWFRVQAAFARMLRATRPDSVVVLGVNLEAGESVIAAAAAAAAGRPLHLVEVGASLAALRRAHRARFRTSEDVEADPPGLQTLAARSETTREAARRLAAGATASSARGVILHSRSRLYTPIRDALVSALGPEVADLDDILGAGVCPPISVKSEASLGAVHGWVAKSVRERLTEMLAMDDASLDRRLAAIVSRFISSDLPGLILADVASRAAINEIRPSYGVVLPTRAPALRIVARNLMDAGAEVHEVQAVYLSRMPRYRAPLADRFYALDSYSARDVASLFDMSADAVRIGGAFRPSVRQRHRAAHLPGATLNILLATQPEPLGLSVARLAAVLEALRQVKSPWRLNIRPHPSEGGLRVEAYRTQLATAGVEADFGGEIADADLLITGFSNTVLEAAARDIRALIYWPSRTAAPVPYARMGLALAAGTPRSLAALIRDCAAEGPKAKALDAARRRYLRANPRLFGGAATHVAEVIRNSAADS